MTQMDLNAFDAVPLGLSFATASVMPMVLGYGLASVPDSTARPLRIRWLEQSLTLIAGGLALTPLLAYAMPEVPAEAMALTACIVIYAALYDRSTRTVPDLATGALTWLPLILAAAGVVDNADGTRIYDAAATWICFSAIAYTLPRLNSKSLFGLGDVMLITAFAAWTGALSACIAALLANVASIAACRITKPVGPFPFVPTLAAAYVATIVATRLLYGSSDLFVFAY